MHLFSANNLIARYGNNVFLIWIPDQSRDRLASNYSKWPIMTSRKDMSFVAR